MQYYLTLTQRVQVRVRKAQRSTDRYHDVDIPSLAWVLSCFVWFLGFFGVLGGGGKGRL